MLIKDRFYLARYEAFLKEVLEKTTQHLIIFKVGARYQTANDMLKFFNYNNDRYAVEQLPRYSPQFNQSDKLPRNSRKKPLTFAISLYLIAPA